MNLEQLMQRLGEKNVHLLIRFDPERDNNKFTIIVNSIRLCDCDNPTKKLQDYYNRILDENNKSIGV